MDRSRGGTRVALLPDVLYTDRAVAVEPRKPPPVGVTGGIVLYFEWAGVTEKHVLNVLAAQLP